MALSLHSWLYVSFLDLISADSKGCTRDEIKEAVGTNDARLQLVENPFSDGTDNQLILKVNSGLNVMVKGDLLSRKEFTNKGKGADLFELTEEGKKLQQHFQNNRHLIKPLKKPTEHIKKPVVPQEYGEEADELYGETMSILALPAALEKALDQAEKLIITALTNIPEVALAAQATEKTPSGRKVIKNNRLITSMKRVAVYMQNIERTVKSKEVSENV